MGRWALGLGASAALGVAAVVLGCRAQTPVSPGQSTPAVTSTAVAVAERQRLPASPGLRGVSLQLRLPRVEFVELRRSSNLARMATRIGELQLALSDRSRDTSQDAAAMRELGGLRRMLALRRPNSPPPASGWVDLGEMSASQQHDAEVEAVYDRLVGDDTLSWSTDRSQAFVDYAHYLLGKRKPKAARRLATMVVDDGDAGAVAAAHIVLGDIAYQEYDLMPAYAEYQAAARTAEGSLRAYALLAIGVIDLRYDLRDHEARARALTRLVDVLDVVDVEVKDPTHLHEQIRLHVRTLVSEALRAGSSVEVALRLIERATPREDDASARLRMFGTHLRYTVKYREFRDTIAVASRMLQQFPGQVSCRLAQRLAEAALEEEDIDALRLAATTTVAVLDRASSLKSRQKDQCWRLVEMLAATPVHEIVGPLGERAQ